MTEPTTEAGRRLRHLIGKATMLPLDVFDEDILETEQEAREPLEAALRDAFDAMDAACRWAATQTGGIKTIKDADRHIKGYDALLEATVRAGKAAGMLR